MANLTEQPAGGRRRRPNRRRACHNVTVDPLVWADLKERARTAAAPAERSPSAQIDRLWRRAAGTDYMLGRQIEGDVGVILGVISVVRPRLLLPENREQLDKALRAALRLAKLGADLRGGRG